MNGRDICVPRDFVCDGANDCSSGEDEAVCRMLMPFSNDRCVRHFQFCPLFFYKWKNEYSRDFFFFSFSNGIKINVILEGNFQFQR